MILEIAYEVGAATLRPYTSSNSAQSPEALCGMLQAFWMTVVKVVVSHSMLRLPRRALFNDKPLITDAVYTLPLIH